MGTITTSDGITLRYLEAGSGAPLVMAPGWSQTAAQLKHQLEGLGDRYHVIALDMRGHGESDKPTHGYRISRFAKDLHDALMALGLTQVNLLGHSLGCAVVWCYLDMFGPERIAKLIFVDQSPFLTANPAWSKSERAAAESAMTPAERLDPISVYESANLDQAVANRRSKRRCDAASVPRQSVHREDAGKREGLGPRHDAQAAARLCRPSRLQPRHAGLVRRRHAHHAAHPTHRRQGESDPVEVARLDARAHPRLAPRDVRGGQRAASTSRSWRSRSRIVADFIG